MHSQEGFYESNLFTWSLNEYFVKLLVCACINFHVKMRSMCNKEPECHTLGVLCGDEGLDERVGGLCVKREGVTE